MNSFSEDSALQPTILGGAMMEALPFTHPSTSTSCSHGCINPLKQQKLEDTSKLLFRPLSRTDGVFHCDIINNTLCSGKCGTGSEQLLFWGRTTIWYPGVHQRETFPSRRNGSVRVDALRQSRQSHPGGG